jgi:hypothetical protein
MMKQTLVIAALVASAAAFAPSRCVYFVQTGWMDTTGSQHVVFPREGKSPGERERERVTLFGAQVLETP